MNKGPNLTAPWRWSTGQGSWVLVVFGLRFELTKRVKTEIKTGIPGWKRESEKTVRKSLKGLFGYLSIRHRNNSNLEYCANLYYLWSQGMIPEGNRAKRTRPKSFQLPFPGLSSRFRTDFVFFPAYPETVGKMGKRGRSGRELSWPVFTPRRIRTWKLDERQSG